MWSWIASDVHLHPYPFLLRANFYNNIPMKAQKKRWTLCADVCYKQPIMILPLHYCKWLQNGCIIVYNQLWHFYYNILLNGKQKSWGAHYNNCIIRTTEKLHINQGLSWSWSYGNWICNSLTQPMQSVPITTNVVTSNPTQAGWTRYNIVIKLVSDLWQVGGLLQVLRFPPSIKLTAKI